ncbi:MAG: hypothetical protein LBR80_17970 [Deltaproteobacteria bacterium]|nr:hypothetical protein [Deltaproteobacteria bacterium]
MAFFSLVMLSLAPAALAAVFPSPLLAASKKRGGKGRPGKASGGKGGPGKASGGRKRRGKGGPKSGGPREPSAIIRRVDAPYSGAWPAWAFRAFGPTLEGLRLEAEEAARNGRLKVAQCLWGKLFAAVRAFHGDGDLRAWGALGRMARLWLDLGRADVACVLSFQARKGFRRCRRDPASGRGETPEALEAELRFAKGTFTLAKAQLVRPPVPRGGEATFDDLGGVLGGDLGIVGESLGDMLSDLGFGDLDSDSGAGEGFPGESPMIDEDLDPMFPALTPKISLRILLRDREAGCPDILAGELNVAQKLLEEGWTREAAGRFRNALERILPLEGPGGEMAFAARRGLARALTRSGYPRAAAELYRENMDIRAKAHGTGSIEDLSDAGDLGLVLFFAGDPLAEEVFGKAEEGIFSLRAPWSREAISAMTGRALILQGARDPWLEPAMVPKEDLLAALALYDEISEAYRESGQFGSEDELASSLRRVSILGALGRHKAAEAAGRRAMDRAEDFFGDEEPLIFIARTYVAESALAAGRDGALEMCVHSLEALLAALGPVSRDLVDACVRIGEALLKGPDPAGGLACFASAVQILETGGGPGDFRAAAMRVKAARRLQGLGEHGTAAAAIAVAMGPFARALSPWDPLRLDAGHMLGEARLADGDARGAASALQCLLGTLDGPDGERIPDAVPRAAAALGVLGRALLGAGEAEGARRAFARELSLREDEGEAEGPYGLRAVAGLAEAAEALGDAAGALELHRQAYEGRKAALGLRHPETVQSREATKRLSRKRMK